MKHATPFFSAAIWLTGTFLFPAFSPAQFTSSWGVAGVTSSTPDIAHAVAIDGSGVFVVGTEGPGSTWHIEKRALTDGALMTAFDGDGIVTVTSGLGIEAYDVAIDGTGIYVVGMKVITATPTDWEWRIEKRNLTSGALITAFDGNGIVDDDPSGTTTCEARGVAVDASGLYIVGYNNGNDWRIEKRDPTNGSLITAFDGDGIITGAAGGGLALDVAVDASGLYVAGDNGRIEKRDPTTGALIAGFGASGVVTSSVLNPGITLDASGLYVVGKDNPGVAEGDEWRIEKRDLTTGALIAAFGTGGVIINNITSGGCCSNGDAAFHAAVNSIGAAGAVGLYVVGYAKEYDREWYVEKRDRTTGDILCTYINDFSSDGSSWTDDWAENVAVDISGNVYVVGSDLIPGFPNNEWRMQKLVCTDVLPIELLSFTANCTALPSAIGGEVGVRVNWSTATELNNDYFTIERSTSPDPSKGGGLNWEVAGTVKGAGNSSSIKNYEFIDNSLPFGEGKGGVVYYRLTQTDYDGKTEVFNNRQIAVEMNCGSGFTVFPNPSSGPFNVSVNAKKGDKVLIVVRDVLGNEFYSHVITISNDKQVIVVDSEKPLAPGIYMIIAASNNKVYHQKKMVIK